MFNWIAKLFSEPNSGGPSSRRVAMAASVTVALGLCMYSVICRCDIPPGAIQILQILLPSSIGAVVVGRFAEGKSGAQ